MALRISTYVSRWRLRQLMSHNDRLFSYLEHHSYDIPKLLDEFFGPAIDTNKWGVNNGGGAGAASFATLVGTNNGVVRGTTGTANDSTAASYITSGRNFRGDQNCVFLCRIALTAITGVKVEVGFGDALAGAATHVVNGKAANTFTATDGVVWILDTSDNGNWEGRGVANGTAATAFTPSNNIVPVASTYEGLMIALLDGTAYFSHFNAAGERDFSPEGTASGTSGIMANAVTSTVLLTPKISILARNATSKSLDVDKILAYQAMTSK